VGRVSINRTNQDLSGLALPTAIYLLRCTLLLAGPSINEATYVPREIPMFSPRLVRGSEMCPLRSPMSRRSAAQEASAVNSAGIVMASHGRTWITLNAMPGRSPRRAARRVIVWVAWAFEDWMATVSSGPTAHSTVCRRNWARHKQHR